MLSNKVNMILSLLATAMLIIFTFALAESISSGFAGFWGGLPFWVIVIFVAILALYDFYDECIRKPSEGEK